MRVVAPLRAVNLVFGAVFGASDVDISAQAEASLKVDSYADCALCIVGFGPHDLQNGDAKVSGGSVAINGDVSLKANGEVTVEGQTNDDGTRRVRHDQHLGDRDRQHLHPGAAAAPAADRGPPGVDPAAEQPVLDHPEEQHQPLRDGRRPRSRCLRRLRLRRPTASCEPGLYVVTGDWELAGNENLSGTGVTLYFTCGTQVSPRPCNAPGEEGGRLVAHGNGL